MAFGPPICACCGSTEGVEEHHLYLKVDGCPDDLTVWLCEVCHGRVHQHQGAMDRRAAIRKGVQRTKEMRRWIVRRTEKGMPNPKSGASRVRFDRYRWDLPVEESVGPDGVWWADVWYDLKKGFITLEPPSA